MSQQMKKLQGLAVVISRLIFQTTFEYWPNSGLNKLGTRTWEEDETVQTEEEDGGNEENEEEQKEIRKTTKQPLWEC